MGYHTDNNDNLVYFDSGRGGKKTMDVEQPIQHLNAAYGIRLRMDANELKLREIAALLLAGGNGLNTADGELRDTQMAPVIDFLRDTPADIGYKIWQRNQLLIAKARSQEPAS